MPGVMTRRKATTARSAFAESELVPSPRAVRKLALLVAVFLLQSLNDPCACECSEIDVRVVDRLTHLR